MLQTGDLIKTFTIIHIKRQKSPGNAQPRSPIGLPDHILKSRD